MSDPGDTRPVRVAWMHLVVPQYRVALINRLCRQPGIALELYAGQANPGVSVEDAVDQVETPVHRLVNVWRPGGHSKVVWVRGWWPMVSGRYDVVITNEGVHNPVNWLLLFLRLIFRYRLLIIGHIRFTGEQGGLMAKLRKFLVCHADGVIAYARDGADQAAAWGIPAEHIAVMGNALELPEATDERLPDDPAVAEALALFDTEALTLLYLGRLYPLKRVDVAVDTVLELERRGVPVQLIVIGDGPEREALAARAAASRAVHFLGAVFDQQLLAAYVRRADLLFIPGGVGLAVIHAFTYGVPLMTAADAEHGPEIAVATDGVNAIISERCDAALFADAVDRLSRDPERLASLAEAAGNTKLRTMDEMAGAIAEMLRRYTPSRRG